MKLDFGSVLKPSVAGEQFMYLTLLLLTEYAAETLPLSPQYVAHLCVLLIPQTLPLLTKYASLICVLLYRSNTSFIK
jgi:hypothetical protein